MNGKSDPQTFELISNLHLHFGLHRNDNKWVLRDWIPNVKEVYMMGDFNQWERKSHPLNREPSELYGEDVWSISFNDSADGSSVLCHKMKYKLHIVTKDDHEIDRVPPCSSVVWKSQEAELFDAAVWNPPVSECHSFEYPSPARPTSPKIYEAYVGLSSRHAQTGTYNEFRTCVLPRIHRLGYNTLILLGVPQHSLTSVGWRVSNFLAPTAEFGTPEEFKALIDTAHGTL